MTKEELKQEAEKYAEGMAKYYASTHEGFIPSQFEKYLRNACVSSAEPREKRIAELEAQIEKMKCCNNCKYRCYMDWKSKCCFDMTEIRDIENPITCKCEKWELAE